MTKKELNDCPECGGTGEVPCPECGNGTILCPVCDGYGKEET